MSADTNWYDNADTPTVGEQSGKQFSKSPTGLQINLNEVRGSDEFPVVPEDGFYPAKVVKVSQDVSRTSGNDMLVWEFKLTSGEAKNMDVKMWTSLTQKALFKLKDTLDALGLLPEDGDVDFQFEEAVGLPCILQIKRENRAHKTKKNRDNTPKMVLQNTVEEVLPPDQEAVEAAEGFV